MRADPWFPRTTWTALVAVLYLAFLGCGGKSDERAGSDHAGHDHAGHDHSGHDHSGHDHPDEPAVEDEHAGCDHGAEEAEHAGHEAHAEEAEHGEGCGCEEEDEHAGHDHSGHGHGSHGHSDLSRPIDELLAARCEHGVAAVECDQCRYEVGAVRVDPKLEAIGLVRVVASAEQSVELPIEMNATVGFNELRTVHVSPRVTGIVRSLRVDYGDEVKAGTTLFTLDSQELGEATGEYLEVRAEATLAEQTLARQAELRAAGVTSEREYLEAQQQSESAGIRYKTARDRLVRLGLSRSEVDGLQAGGDAAVGLLNVRSPQAGTVLDLHATPGEQVEPGSQVALVGDLQTVWIWADVYEEDMLAVTEALAAGAVTADFRAAAIPGRTFTGTVDMLGSSLDPATRTTRARVSVENPDRLLRPGMFGTAQLHLRSVQGAVVVPDTALCIDGDDTFVFVRVREDLFFRRPVVVGRASEGLVAVRSGLTAGQEVVADGSFLLKSDVLREKMGAGCAH